MAYVMESGEIFTYGHNSVFSCGHGTDDPVLKSKLVEYFWNTNTTCKHVEVNTRSTIFLTRDGASTQSGISSMVNSVQGIEQTKHYQICLFLWSWYRHSSIETEAC